ncbi:MAG: GDSL-type esterase/lipase family protein [Candidatus Omnitrophica bacterium]|nr:GDSL-type esterase/lipase family protein [Candidatus Omnitrophota bacterium]
MIKDKRVSRCQAAVTFFLGAILLFGCAKQEIKNAGRALGKEIICFGDSLTFGYGAGPAEDYPTALKKYVRMPVINSGVDGDTTIHALRRFQVEVLNKDPYLVIVEFCGNDFIQKIPQETTIRNLRQIIRKSQEKGAIVALVDISAGFFLRDYRHAYKKLAREEGAIFVPAILNGILTNPSMKSDFLHPNGSGYTIVAGRIYNAIKPYLKENKE